jgi:cytochrome P450
LPIIRAARAEAPLARSTRGIEVLGYDGCAAVYADPDMHSATPLFAASMGLDMDALHGPGRTLTLWEGEDHATLRAVVSRWFTPRRVGELRPAVIDHVKGLVEPVTARGGGDFAREIARRIPAPVFCWMMGAPVSRAEELFELSNTMLAFFAGDPEHAGAIAAANVRMAELVDELVSIKRRAPGDDLMTILLEAVEAGSLTMDDAYSIALELLIASSDNTAKSACHIVWQLAHGARPDRSSKGSFDWERLRSEPALLPGAIEECLRFDPVVLTDMHVSQRPSRIEGFEIPGGTVAWLSILGANHDPSVYPEPEVFDIARKHARPQLNFGLGRHFCIGAALARMELEALLSVLVAEWSGVALPQGLTAEGRAERAASLPISVER